MTKKTTAFDVFEKCVQAVQAGELIESVSAKDKEFHFQNWFQKAIRKSGLKRDQSSPASIMRMSVEMSAP